MYIYAHLRSSALLFEPPYLYVQKCTFSYTWITFLYIFKIFFFCTTKKHFFQRAKKMWLNVFARKKHFGTFYHTSFSLHISTTFYWLPSASFRRLCFFSKKMFSYVHFPKNVIQVHLYVFKMYIFAHFIHPQQ